MKMFSWDALQEHQFGAVKHIHIGKEGNKKIKRKFELTDSEVCLIFLIKFIHYVLTLDYKKEILACLSISFLQICFIHIFTLCSLHDRYI